MPYKSTSTTTFTVVVQEDNLHDPTYIVLEQVKREMVRLFGPDTKVTADD